MCLNWLKCENKQVVCNKDCKQLQRHGTSPCPGSDCGGNLISHHASSSIRELIAMRTVNSCLAI